jgi:hypothetical protein
MVGMLGYTKITRQLWIILKYLLPTKPELKAPRHDPAIKSAHHLPPQDTHLQRAGGSRYTHLQSAGGPLGICKTNEVAHTSLEKKGKQTAQWIFSDQMW